MACSGCGGGGSSKMSNHSPKKAPNWGMTTNPEKRNNNSTIKSSGGFGTPKVKMSFRGKR